MAVLLSLLRWSSLGVGRGPSGCLGTLMHCCLPQVTAVGLAVTAGSPAVPQLVFPPALGFTGDVPGLGGWEAVVCLSVALLC